MLTYSGIALAQSGKAAAPGESLVFAVSEGTSGLQDSAEVLLKYEDLVRLVSSVLERKVVFILARDFTMLEEGIRRERYDFVMARPSDYPARAVRDHRYQLVTTSKPRGHAVFIVRNDSPIKTLADVHGRQIALPEKLAYMSRVATAVLRDNGIDSTKEQVTYHRDQEVIGFAVEAQIAEVGAVASYSRVAREWENKKGRILFRGPPKPYMPLVASRRIPPEKVAKLRQMLIALTPSDDPKGILKRLRITGFEESNPQELIELLKWLGY